MTSKLVFTLLLSMLLAVGLTGYGSAIERYVDANNGSNDYNGGSGDPWLTITWALEHVSGSEADPVTIHVAAGTYAVSTNSETYPLNMESWVSLLGDAADTPILDAEDSFYHVICCDNVDNIAIESLTLTGALAYGEGYDRFGGGIMCYYADVTITNCIISGNRTAEIGGGICSWGSTTSIENCTISYNTTDFQTGGGMWCWSGSLNIHNSSVVNNTADVGAAGILLNDCPATIDSSDISANTTYGYQGGGGIDCHYCSPTIMNCTISDNTAASTAGGGGIRCYQSSPMVTNCLITGNCAGDGGGVFCLGRSKPRIENCTITGNTAAPDYYLGGGIFCADGCRPKVANSILWANSPEQIGAGARAGITVTYSCIEGGWDGRGNIADDPAFATGPLGEYYLGSTSPCTNAGSMSAEEAGLSDRTTQVLGTLDTGTVDMGYHYEVVGMPTAHIDSIEPNPATEGVDVHFIGHGDPDGSIVAWLWTSNLQAEALSTEEDFTNPASDLEVGTHTISFKVQDDEAEWSAPDTAELTIKAAGGPQCDINRDGLEDDLNSVGAYIKTLKLGKTLERTLVGILRTAQRFFDKGNTDAGCIELQNFIDEVAGNVGSFPAGEAVKVRNGVCCINDRIPWGCEACPWE